ncbi:hypothetical protein BEWA_003700 [Theileria equi strain WA]|uniref:Uncharacterized protein n=1 Tax=Theileria equi strain WA TaxID=1537102 RepID=L0AZF1_THEEQ|nr:hypothetical protein BEWA_003700 [Theileria equi strain WA]AFZ80962.1 hypothetical protein BEWA_003700 [Theileria equi strain WA]|eukprot:XP_004830628.1 hypothetical protein BEWA_003700 [Theileria equi strain WA]
MAEGMDGLGYSSSLPSVFKPVLPGVSYIATIFLVSKVFSLCKGVFGGQIKGEELLLTILLLENLNVSSSLIKFLLLLFP